MMSTVFEVPCPDCGRQMSVEADGVTCSNCRRAYHLWMGHLFRAGEPWPPEQAVGPASTVPSAPS